MSKMFAIRIDEKMLKEIDIIARKKMRTKSNLIKMIIQNYIDQQAL